MSAGDVFFDTGVLLYLLSEDTAKADRVAALLEQSGVVSVQVLNEFAAVALRKARLSLQEIRDVLDTVRAVCAVQPLTTTTHDLGLDVCERYRFSLYDSMIVASARIASAKTLYSEDLQHGQVIDRQLRIIDPFRAR